MEAKLAQQLAGLCHEPLFQFLLYVQKYYKSLDRGRCMEILRGYGLGLNLQRILKHLWGKKEMVTNAGKCFGQPFGKERGVNQGDPFSPTICGWMQW